MDERIVEFITKMHIFSLGVVCDEQPYLCSCFYAYDEINNSLVFASDDSSKHIKAIKKQPKVAINIALDTKIVGIIKGVQATGAAREATNKNVYFKRFPYALALNPKLYEIKLEWIKYTDNALGFGTKLTWSLGE
ncbi:putative protein, pyridoxine 5'-phosphate oxidase family [Campylobacter iguaniorum]|uniref:Uncharacterized protein n=1 Tax=Campylobacter iguaniorum TaxID=1244531 RepID=A0A076FH28_9BACT|nr:pyridoxamine 5'-phosphate oxidase family protein [Campylobacter iguaniorum]AII15129.1 hypothetical protein, pyridoxine 5'-phosphate oxidase family [Campylobacter iguaniorum]ALV24996.1 putative protein, pyridoxine 5'-phosphate oxidase family [Campylobacter iguaniorum]